MSVTYKNSPIVEALCEFRFKDVLLNQENVGVFYEKIKEHFPVKKKASTQTFQLIIDTQQDEAQKMQRSASEFDQFLSEDGKYLLNLVDSRVSIHRLKPYISWLDFYPKISTVIDAYLEVFKPTVLERSGIRYINNISYPAKDFDFNTYFNVGISFPSINSMGRSTSQFIGSVLDFNEGCDKLKIQLGENPSNSPEVKSYVMDVDYYSTTENVKPTVDFLQNWISDGHQSLEDVFEGVMTTSSKDLFK